MLAWRSKPTWYIVAKNDHTIQPDRERFLAKRMNATTIEVTSSRRRRQPNTAKPSPFFGGIAAPAAACVLAAVTRFYTNNRLDEAERDIHNFSSRRASVPRE